MNAFRKTPEEKYQLILEYRRSGMSDLDWCRKNGIKLDTFRTWIRRLQREARFPIPPSTVTSSCRLPINEAVQLDVQPEEDLQDPEDDKNTFIPPAMTRTAAPSIEIETHGVTFRFFGPVDASLYEKTLLMLEGQLCSAISP